MNVELNNDEADILRELIERRLEELGPEIHHTRTLEFRDGLKKQREQLEGLQKRLSQAAAA